MSGKMPCSAREYGELSGNCDRPHRMVVKLLTVAAPSLVRPATAEYRRMWPEYVAWIALSCVAESGAENWATDPAGRLKVSAFSIGAY